MLWIMTCFKDGKINCYLFWNVSVPWILLCAVLECLESRLPLTLSHSESVIFHFLQTNTLSAYCLSVLELSVLCCYCIPLSLKHCHRVTQIDLQMPSTADKTLSPCLLCSDAPRQDLKPVDVTNKRSLWENKGATPTKVALLISALSLSSSIKEAGWLEYQFYPSEHYTPWNKSRLV